MVVSTVDSSPTKSFGYGFKPKQNIPESQKSEVWAMENVDWIVSMSPMFVRLKSDDYYSLYNGQRSTEQFNHITKTYGIEFPAGKLKHIPLARPLINRLLSEAEERQFEFTAHSEDTDSIEDKIAKVSEQLLVDIIKVIKSGDNPEKAIPKLQEYYQKERKSEMEISLQHYMNDYILKYRLDRQLSECFRDKCISGQEFYRVKVNRIGEDPEFTAVRPGTLFYANNNKKWIAECDWAIQPMMLTPTEILDKFGERMKPEDVKTIESWIDMYDKDMSYKLIGDTTADSLVEGDSSQMHNASVDMHKIAVYRTEWKSIRKVYYLQNKNKYADDAPWTKLLDNESLREITGKRKESVQFRYIQDLWEGVRIGDNMYVDLGRVKYPTRSISDPSKVNLSYNGLTHNDKIKPYSLIGETEDLQNLYDILHFHKENLVAMSGSKGSYMDLSQMPDFGTGNPDDNLKLFMYYKKMGTAFIDRKKEGADKNFNTFPSYDDTMGAGLQAILLMIQHIEDVAGRVIGVNRQQLGATAYFDGKSTTEQAIQNSAMVTEFMFNEHDELTERALTDIANASRISHKNGKTGYYTDNNRVAHIYKLDDITFPYSDLGIHITNKSSDKRSIQELKQMSAMLVKQGMMPFEDLLPMFKQNGLTEILRQIEVNTVRRRIEMEEQQQNLQEIQIKLQQAKDQAEVGKLTAQAEEIAHKIQDNKTKLQLEAQALSEKSSIDRAGLDLDQKRVDLEALQLELYAKENSVKKSAEVKNN